MRLHIDLKQIKRIDPEAVACFVAVMQSKGEGVSGNVPQDQECKWRLHDFGFFEYVQGGPNLGVPAGKIRLLESGHKVEGHAAQKIIEFGLARLGSTASRKHGPTYTVFTEAMANTFQHANRRKPGSQNWRAGVYYDNSKQAACFTLVDLGIGVLKSVRKRYRVKSWLAGLKSGERLRLLLSGNIPSRTGEKHRGRGLPNMKNACLAGRIRNLMIVSNNAWAHVERDEYRELESDFPGTIIYWEVAKREEANE